jgi:hypothetical protein
MKDKTPWWTADSKLDEEGPLQLDDEDSIPWLLNLHQKNRTMCL